MEKSSIQFPKIDKTKLMGILPFVEKAVQFLKNTNDYTTLEVGTALDFLYDAYFKDENAIPQEGARHGLGKLFLKIWMPLSGHYTPSDTSQAGYNLIRMT